VFAPLSIPSPSSDWQSLPIGRWLHDLGLTFIDPNLFNVRTYALCILVGIIAALILTSYRLTRRGAEPGVVLDIVLWAVPFGIIGARIYHVLTHPNDYFGEGKDILTVFYIWEGGIAIFGALLGGALGAWIGCKITGVRFWTFADAVAPGLLLAQAFGRFGNWFNHELFGLPTNLPWGLEIEADNPAFPIGLPADTLFHPTFLYEVVWNLAGVAVLLFLERKWRLEKKTLFGFTIPLFPVGGPVRLQWGKLLGLYLIWYGLGRSFFETIRIDPSEVILGIRTNVWGAFIAIAVGIAILIVQTRKHPGIEPSPYVAGREWNDPSAVDSDETYSENDEPGNEAEGSTEKHATSAAGSKSS
jgi:prolipoprotein diacylglyceryl transferase